MSDFQTLARAMCSMDLIDSHWTQELPRLPVPDLWLTSSRYLASLKAVLAPEDEQAETSGLDAESWKQRRRDYEKAEQLVKEFMLNEGPELQRDLKDHANKCQNWATEFWLQDMYLSNPLPLPVNSNPFFMFPRQHFSTSREMLMFATRIIQFSVDFKYRIDQQSLKQDFGSGHGKGKPLCMATYKNFFHSYRMPHDDMDRLLPQSRRSNHIVVASCDQFYVLRLGQEPLDNPFSREAANQLEEESIFEQLLRIYRVSRERARRAAAGQRGLCLAKVGLFTSENRKTWARIHRRLQTSAGGQAGAKAGNGNVESLRQIEDCLFVMCLDSVVASSGGGPAQAEEPSAATRPSRDHIPSAEERAQVEAASVILAGGGSRRFTANRWFDKFLQVIVGRDGICGINIEHSASEGITVLRFLEDFLKFISANPIHLSPVLEASSSPLAERLATTPAGSQACEPAQGHLEQAQSITAPGYEEPKSPSLLLSETDQITPLSWQLDAELEAALREAEAHVDRLIDNFSLRIIEFAHFGRNFIKQQSLSPDAFIQLALQYTFYKCHGHLVSSYESASLRQFRLGRVDNIRANTCEAYRWILDMLACRARANHDDEDEPGRKWASAEASFVRALTKQVEILRYTILGGGPDNHLLALRNLALIRYDRDRMPELFTDKSYAEFLNFRLSTSQLPNESGITVGYGAVTPDGYGCSYNPRAESIVFCVSSFVDCAQTSSSKFARILAESLLEMQQLCLGRGSGSKQQ